MAWDLLRVLLAREGWPDAVLSNPCARCGGPHGAVQVSGAPWRAAVSYAGGAAVAAILVGLTAAAEFVFAVPAGIFVARVGEQRGLLVAAGVETGGGVLVVLVAVHGAFPGRTSCFLSNANGQEDSA